MKSTRNKFVQNNVTHYIGVWVLFWIGWKEGICFMQEKMGNTVLLWRYFIDEFRAGIWILLKAANDT